MSINVEFYDKIVQFPDGTSKETINNVLTEESNRLKTEEVPVQSTAQNQPMEVKETLEDSYLQGRAKIGVGSGVAGFQAIADTAINTLSLGHNGQTWTEFGNDFMKNYREREEESVDFLARIFPWDKPDVDLQPSSLKEQILGMGLEMAADPLLFLSWPTKGIGVAKNAAQIGIKGGIRATQWGATGAVAGYAGELGANAEEFFTGKDTGVGRAVGSIGSILGTARVASPMLLKAEDRATAFLKNKEPLENSIEGSLDSAAKVYANKKTTAIIKEISKAETKNVEKIMDDYSQIAEYLEYSPGPMKTTGPVQEKINIPFFVSMSENPVAKGELNRLIRKEPRIRAQANNAIDQVTNLIEQKSNSLFGVPISGDLLSKKITTSEVRIGLNNRLNGLKKAKAKITNKINELNSSLSPSITNDALSIEIESLVKSQKKIAKAIRSTEYTAIEDAAKKAKVFMPPEGVKPLWDYVKSVRLDDKFGAQTSLQTKILSYLKPKKVTETIKGSDGKVKTKSTMVYPKMSFSNVMSLKEAINKEMRKKGLPDGVYYQLQNLKDALTKSRETIPGTYNVALAAADDNYYKFIGIPYTKEGIAEIGKKKYKEKIAPVIVQNAESLQQFLDVVPRDKGLEIAKNAMLAEVYSKGIVDGVLNPVQIRKIIKNKSEVIDLIPGLREELVRSYKYKGYLATRLKTLDTVLESQQKKIGEHFLIRSGGVEGYAPSKIVADLIKDRKKLTIFMKDVDKLEPGIREPVLNTIRRQFIANIAKSEGGAMAWMRNPENKYVLDKIMIYKDANGKIQSYYNDIQKMARITDKLSRVETEKIASVPIGEVYDPGSKYLGIDIKSIISNIRRPIVSGLGKAGIIGSRIFESGMGARADAILEEALFSDVTAIKKFANLDTKYEGVEFKPKDALKRYTEIMGESLPKYVYAGLTETIRGIEASEGLEEGRENRLEKYRNVLSY